MFDFAWPSDNGPAARLRYPPPGRAPSDADLAHVRYLGRLDDSRYAWIVVAASFLMLVLGNGALSC